MRRLTIRRLIAKNFGGLRNRTVPLPDDPFLVLYGPNESGKSTMAEAMAWLLTNVPEADIDAEMRDRLGGDGSTLSAELDWNLGSTAYRSRGIFKLTKTTVSKTSTLEVSGPDQDELDVGELGTLLGGTDYEVFDHVFRVRGEDGHIETDGNVSGLIQRTALGGSEGGIRSRDVIADLEKREKSLTTSKKQGSESVTTLLESARKSAEEIDEAGRNAEQFREVQTELAGRQKRKDELNSELVELGERVSVLKTAQNAREPFHKIQGLQAELDEAPEPDPAWNRFVDRLDDFDQAVDADIEAGRKLGETEGALLGALDDLGPPWTRESLTDVTLSRESVDDIRKMVGALGIETKSMETADVAVTGWRRTVTQAEADLETAEQRWRELEPDADPGGWLAELEVSDRAGTVNIGSEGQPQADPETSLPTVLAAATAGLGAVIAVVGFVAGQPLIGLLGIAVAGAGGVITWLTRQSTSEPAEHPGDGLPTVDEAGLRARRTAAQEVVDARDHLGSAARDRRAAEEEVTSQTEAVDDLRGQISDRLRDGGVRVPVDAAEADDLADRVLVARTALSQLDTETAKRSAAAERLSDICSLAPDDWPSRTPDAIRAESVRQNEFRGTRTGLEQQLLTERSTYQAVVAGNEQVGQTLSSVGSGALDELVEQALGSKEAKEHERDEKVDEIGGLRQQLIDLRSAEELEGLRFDQDQLRSEAEEKLAEAVVVAATRVLLTEVVERFERENRPAIVKGAERIVRKVNPDVAELHATSDAGAIELGIETTDGIELPDEVLSTGGRALLYLSLRLAAAEHESEKREVRLPILLDDALVHLDDGRLGPMVEVLAELSTRHQVLLFTCHERTVNAARRHGAALVDLAD